MKIENVNDIIAFTKKAMDYSYNIQCYNYNNYFDMGETYLNMTIESVNNSHVTIHILKNKIVTEGCTFAKSIIEYKLTQKDKALLDLLAVDIDEYRANKMKDIIDKFFEPEKDSDTNNLNDED